MLAVAGLALLAVVLAWPTPRLMATMALFRRAPRAALVVWQAVSLAAVVAALATAPAAIPLLLGESPTLRGHLGVVAAGAAVSGLMLARLLLSGHRVGSRLRALRRRHRELVDVIAEPFTQPRAHNVRVIEHPTPTAYCLPGLRRRVVLSQGTIDALPPDELAAVLAHERAHLRARHDLVLEFFTVLHGAVPRVVRSEAALREVRLLAEVLADRAAVREVGELPMARALVRLASSHAPEAALGAGQPVGVPPSAARVRLDLLASPSGKQVLLSAAMYAFAAAALLLPVALLALAWH